MDSIGGEVLSKLPVFAAFAQTGTVTGAADVTGIPQPTVSRILARAENELGIKLRIRRGRVVEPTAAALRLGQAAENAIALVEQGIMAANRPINQPIRLAFQHSLGADLIPQLIRNHQQYYADDNFVLVQGSRDHCLTEVTKHHSDLAFIAIPPDRLRFDSHELYREQLVAAVPQSHPLAESAELNITDLSDQKFIAFVAGFGLRATVDNLLQKYGVKVKLTFTGQEIRTLLGLVAAGLGITVVPRQTDFSGVTQIPFRQPDAYRPILMVRRKGPFENPAAQAFWQGTAALQLAAGPGERHTPAANPN